MMKPKHPGMHPRDGTKKDEVPRECQERREASVDTGERTSTTGSIMAKQGVPWVLPSTVEVADNEKLPVVAKNWAKRQNSTTAQK